MDFRIGSLLAALTLFFVPYIKIIGIGENLKS